jgi:hypothetical protein
MRPASAPYHSKCSIARPISPSDSASVLPFSLVSSRPRLGVGAQQPRGALQQGAALGGHHLAPPLEPVAGGGQCLVEIAGAGDRVARDRLLGRRVDHRRIAAGTRAPAPGDEQVERAQISPLFFGRLGDARF